MENQFLKDISESLVLDSTREDFAKETFKTLCNLKNGINKNHTGHQRLLLGRKGVGKTVFLKEIQVKAKKIFGDDLIIIYREFLSTDKIIKPSFLIAEALQNLSLKEDIKLCEKELKRRKKFVFIVLDEIQNLYLQNDDGKSVINQLSEIGGSREGCIHSIITGSSSHLRQLCFAKLSSKIKGKYPNYISLDLNSTKYSSRWIYPFCEIEDFERLTVFTYQKSEIEYTVSEASKIALLYLKTGGNPRLLKELVQGERSFVDSYSVSLKHFQNEASIMKSKILESVFLCTSAFVDKTSVSTIEDVPASVSTFKSWTKLFSYSFFLEKFIENIGKNMSEDLLPLIYDLADSGHLRYIDNQFNQLVGLGSPLIYLQLANDQCAKQKFTMDEIFALKNPSGHYKNIAENVVLEILAKNFHIFEIPGFILRDTNVEKIIFKEDYTNIKSAEIYACHNLDSITNKLFKESYMSCTNQREKNSLGIDGISLQSNENKLIAHRIQIKLGSQKNIIHCNNVKDIIENVEKSKITFEKCFESADKQVPNCIYYLVTTCSIEPDARKKLEEANWKIIDRAKLGKIWPAIIKQLGQPYST